MPKILQNVRHIVVVMFENRSLDTMLGLLYPDGALPERVLPAGSPPAFDGIRPGMWNPSGSGQPVPVSFPATGPTVPNPDPQETFDNVTAQIFGPAANAPDAPWPPMSGFVVNYETTSTKDASQIMQIHTPAQLPVLSTLARAYAVSDAWFASVPSQTWPNRSFAHAGTSNGHVNNGDVPDPLVWNVPTIFNVLGAIGTSWAVYSDSLVGPSLTRTMFPTLWDERFSANFQRFDAFVDACATGRLPRYSFLEPRFLIDPSDQHPPHDVRAGERFLHDIWTAVSQSPAWPDTLLLITYDEHGGCFDHVRPPDRAKAPDKASAPGDEGFGFDRFGVRVPFVAVSPYIAPGTVFRSPTDTPYDHASLLATLRDWLDIPAADMLPSARVAAAPTFEQILTLAAPRGDLPAIAKPANPLLADLLADALSQPLNDLQKSLVAGAARRYGLDPRATLDALPTRRHAADFFTRENPGNLP
ncbi:phosphoesterase [Burkholderia sp. WAC0059]|uniref:alkaline phosphatase family protein n=1 Tax=Burkholderia sp. WAC0059 TaxID=2066022 RepID=UPI000C7EC476|nr:alkaline phosphatase family protein [Burkholderia sp. WAC0059]PLZ04060.1 phosphoesterase [Burkholderia sp. WAC0059]